jgi:sirohydrochlorin ferrochelatase
MMDHSQPLLIVAHGQPSAPEPAEAELAALAQAVSAQSAIAGAPRAVGSATLAAEGALARALARLGPRGLVFPMFMAGGWFTRVALGQKLHAAGAVLGAQSWQVLEPFGCDPATHDLARDIVAHELAGQNMARAGVLIAAHGSFKSSAPSDVARALAQKLQRDLGIGRIDAAFIDQSPRLCDAAGFGADALCLPFFAAMGGHVTEDIPQALAQAGFAGRVLPPLGADARVPALIAAAACRAAPVCAQTCRYSAPGG